MNESRQRKEFLRELLEEVEEKAIRTGSYEGPFLDLMMQYIEKPEEPDVLVPPYKDSYKKIGVNAYSYSEEEGVLDLYIVDYDFDQQVDDLLSINMTTLTELANKVKRFITNAKTLKNTIDPALQARDLAVIIENNKNSILEINIYIITNKFYFSNKPVEISIPGIETVNVQVWDVDRVHQLVLAEQGVQTLHIDFEEDLGCTFEMMFVPEGSNGTQNSNFDCYIGFLPAQLLAKAYDTWGPKLVERNVRSFLQARGGTNKGIRDTLKDPVQKKMFVAYNNGISSVAKDAVVEKISEGTNLYRIKGLTGWQIVNGGQTTASIHQAYKNEIDLSDVYIQAKLTILKVEAEDEKDQHILEDEMVSRISEYANTQNKINKSDLLANTRFMSDIEKFSRNTWVPTMDGRKAESKWYFERARGQYMVDINRRKRGKEQNEFKRQYPKEMVITKVDLAKHFMSWEGHPHVSSKGGEAAFTKFMELNKKYWKHEKDKLDNVISLEQMSSDIYKMMIARSIINRHVTNIVGKMNLKGYRANVIYYTVAMLNYIYGDNINLIEVWDKQSLSDKWDNVVQIIANNVLQYLRESAGDQNVTQWAKKEACWNQLKEEKTKELSFLI
ncbi:AIPR family protein [Mesobacillus maritimus]|uniref:AIPR family protein n=1 Tax=Mesobacillus maritimus TaxID=1643336 RepID=UPI00203EE5C5|nr:AIPR family protein [Mesobacillus maritimus]MCM3671074.1 AIPR family protein [Mesobacillus maritimus]